MAKSNPSDDENILSSLSAGAPSRSVDDMLKNLESMSTDEMQATLLRTQLQTALLAREQAEDDARTRAEHKAAISRRNRQRQTNLAKERGNLAAQIAGCNHKQGGGPDNMLEGDGKSALYRAEIFFPGNTVVFCLRCPLRMAKPHPDLRKSDRKAYDAAMTEWQRLIKESKTNGLQPMQGPQYEFTNNETGQPFIPSLV